MAAEQAMARPPFKGRFAQQEPIPETAIVRALEVMRSGRLHRYDVIIGEEPEAALLEREFAAWQGARYCLAVASGGQAMQIALRAAGVKAGDKVLSNAFTLAPVPGAISAVGGEPVLVDITEDLVIDFDDLVAKARAWGARYLLLSNMRGHLCDMDRLAEIATGEGFAVIEDCAHTMGAKWNGRKSGNFGVAGCFSTQTYKHMNSGEGGLLTSDDPTFMARATILSGSYMLYQMHGAGPAPEVFADIRLHTPNMSARMDNLRAAILRPQLAALDDAIARWNQRYDRITGRFAGQSAIRLPKRPAEESYVGSSIQFLIPGISTASAQVFLSACAARGVQLNWFGAEEPVAFTSAHYSWRYVPPQSLPATDRVLSGLFDMRLPLTFSLEDCDLIADHILDAVAVVLRST
jgi:dTDP-4-amino-4,6-dideoxygalactose transaminase